MLDYIFAYRLQYYYYTLVWGSSSIVRSEQVTNSHFMQGRFTSNVIHDHLRNGCYPDGFLKSDKQAFRKRAKFFVANGADLYYVGGTKIWSQVGMDLIGPLLETPRGIQFIVTLADYFTGPDSWLCPQCHST